MGASFDGPSAFLVLYQAAKKGSIFRKTPTGGITRRIWYQNVRENVYFSDLSLYFEIFFIQHGELTPFFAKSRKKLRPLLGPNISWLH